MEKPQLDEVKLREALKTVAKIDLPPAGEPIDEKTENQPWVEQAMVDMGKYLARLHSVRLTGFGYLDEKALEEGFLRGRWQSWYQFWVDFMVSQSEELDKVLKLEEKTGKAETVLKEDTRKLFEKLVNKRPELMEILYRSQNLLNGAESRLLNGNINLEVCIYAKNQKFTGLGDFHQALAGDPVDDLAYFSVLPKGEFYLRFVLKSYGIAPADFSKKMHLYRLLESYRKIFSRYIKHHYLEDYPEPLTVALAELQSFGVTA